ncbi:MAG: hypothetical protein KF796_08740 [Ramlibacter sp.]|nr:hypothetical protein [Ramlibacter sp.]
MHHRFLHRKSLPQTIGELARTPLRTAPTLWTLDRGKHPVPYARPAPLPNRDEDDKLELEDVRLDDGTALGKPAVFVRTGASTSCLTGGYLVSDGFQVCVAVIGASPTRTYLVHVDTTGKLAVQFKHWDRKMTVMIVHKDNAIGIERMKKIKDFCDKWFYNGALVYNLRWQDSTGVVVHRSTCIAYLEGDGAATEAQNAAAVDSGALGV